MDKKSTSSKVHSDNIDGYIHKVSDIRHPASGHRYFKFKVQRMDEDNRVICFSPSKRDELVAKHENKDPVTLVNISPQKRKFQPDITEYSMSNYSRIIVRKNLSFPWRNIVEELDKATINSMHQSCVSGDIVTVTAKVMWKLESEVVFSTRMNKNLTKCDAVIADATGVITVTLFEEAIEKIVVGTTYVFGGF